MRVVNVTRIVGDKMYADDGSIMRGVPDFVRYWSNKVDGEIIVPYAFSNQCKQSFIKN